MKENKNILLDRRLITIAVVLAICLVFFLFYLFRTSSSLENDSRVNEDTLITYYIDVIYDGTDKVAVTSSGDTTAKVYSDYIYVEDKLPSGLTFDGFVETEDGTIGAVEYGNGSQACGGYVVGGYEGLTYDETTGKVTFKVKNLMAGCKLTVGVKVITPKLPSGVKRLDFYNYVNGYENTDSAISNTVHFYVGSDKAELYNVTYKFVGEVPEEAAGLLPSTKSYAAGATVGVDGDVNLEGYIFSGWTTSDVEVDENGNYVMPDKDIEFVGSFVKNIIPEYTVNYSIDGPIPEGFAPPKDKKYGVGSDVKLDSLKAGDEINGYRFLGWVIQNSGIETNEDELNTTFVMPAENVNIVGKFEKITYTVSYKFIGINIPPNADSILPPSEQHAPGEKVHLASDPVSSGYKFIAWYSPSEFVMPNEDVIIEGEWMIETGTFRPLISKSISNPKDSYHEGEEINFEIKVTNSELFAIKDVQLFERLDGVEFIPGEGYTVKNSQFVLIDELAATSSIIVYAKYKAGTDLYQTYTNTVELTGAIADNGYNLDQGGNYKASIDFVVANISLEITKINEKGEELAGAKFGLYSDVNATNKVDEGLVFIGLEANKTYYIKELVAPVGYKLSTEIFKLTVNSDAKIEISGLDVAMNNGVGRVSIVNKKIDILPETGGTGIAPYIMVGAVIAVGSIGGYGYYVSRKRNKK